MQNQTSDISLKSLKVCIACDQEVIYRDCGANRFAPIVGRDGRHGGACWEGQFPTEKDLRSWEKTKKRRQEEEAARVEAINDKNIQLGLLIPSVEEWE